jgi:hypothetical protein
LRLGVAGARHDRLEGVPELADVFLGLERLQLVQDLARDAVQTLDVHG